MQIVQKRAHQMNQVGRIAISLIGSLVFRVMSSFDIQVYSTTFYVYASINHLQ